MKKVWIAIMFTLTVIACKTQEDLKKDNKRDYSAEWSTIDEHIKKGFPEKAIKELDSLIEKARAEDDQIVATQAILRRINLKNLDQQDFMKEQMAYLKEQHKITTDPESEAFINYALALVYQNYWESNQNLIPRESEGDDEWDGRRYLAVIDSLIKKVLREDFKKLPVKNVDSFFDSQAYEPTMMLWDYFMLEQIRLQKSLVYKKLLGEEESRNLVEASYDDLVTKLNAQAQVRLAIETEIARLNYKKEDVTSVSLNGRMKYKFIVDYHIALSLLQEAQSAADNKALQSVKYSESAKLFAAVKSAGDSIYSHNAQVQLDFIEKSELSFQIERVLIPNKRSLVYVESRNLSKIFLRIYKLTKDDYLQQNRRNEDGYKNKPIVHEESVDLPLSAYKFVSSSTEIAVPKLPAGYYAIVINNQVNFYDQDKSPLFESDFLVSNLAINNYYDEGTSRMVLECVNRTTGELYDGAQFTVFDSQYDRKLGRQKMIALYEGRGNPTFSYAADVSKSLYPYVEMDGQFFSNSEGLYHNNSKGTARKTSNVFTDRAIYRPGQDIHFKGIVHEHDREGVPRLAQGVKLKVRVTDNMGNEVEVFNFTSDEYGAYTGVVKIPASTQNGSINLNISGDQSRLNAYKTVRVEEYKRPKYEVNFEESAQELKLGEKVSVKAVAMGYTGVPVADAKVNYKVYRSGWWPYFYRGYRSYFPSYDSGRTLLRAGDVMTDGAGAVEIDFIAERSISSPELKNYSYTVELEVVDNTGETKSATKSLNISEQSVFIKFSKTKTEGEYIISTVNSEDQALAARVALEVYRKSVDKYKLERYWRFPDTTVVNIADFSDFSFVNADKAYPESIYRATFEVEDTIRVNLKDIVGAGSFKIKLESGDDAKVEQEIEILDFDNSIYGTNKLFYIEGLSATYQPGDELNLRIGSSVKDVNIQIQMFKNNELISEEWRTVDGFTRISEQITEDDYGGYSVLIKCYYKNRIYHEELQVVVPWLHKKLFIKPKSIRYVTEPGAPEKWTFVVTNKDGKPVQASFLSSMYDISLDEFQPHDWSMSLYRNYFGFYFRRDNSFSGQSLHTRNYGWNNGSLFLKPFEIAPTFRFAPVRFHYFERRMKRSAAPMLDAVTVTGASARVQEEPEAELNEMLAVDIEQDIAAPAPPANVRTNLAELVFFYPDLKTNENGEVSIEFTNNEALTKWKLQNFAFTKDLKIWFFE